MILSVVSAKDNKKKRNNACKLHTECLEQSQIATAVTHRANTEYQTLLL